MVSDHFGHKIRRVTQAGNVTTVAGTGTAGGADGTADTASFNRPAAILVNAKGELVVADYGGNLIREIRRP